MLFQNLPFGYENVGCHSIAHQVGSKMIKRRIYALLKLFQTLEITQVSPF